MDPEIIRMRGLCTSDIGEGSLLQGTIRINPKSYEDGFLCTPDNTSDIYIRGIRDRNRALHGDLVILEVNPVSQWNVLHSNIQDYLDNGGTEEDYRILMKEAKVNIKQEPDKPKDIDDVDGTAPQPVSVNPKMPSRPNTKTDEWGAKPASDTPWDTAGTKTDTFAQNILHQVQFGGHGGSSTSHSGVEEVKPSNFGGAVAPDDLEELDDLDDDCGSDASNDLVYDIEQKIEDEAFRLANLGINPEEQFAKQFGAEASNTAQPQESANTKAVKDIIDIKENCGSDSDEEEVLVESVNGTECSDKKPVRRRGGKRKKSGKNDQKPDGNKGADDLNASVQIIKTTSPTKNRFAKPMKVPLVEYNIQEVLKHPRMTNFVQRTGRVVNIVEFKHSRISAGTLKLMPDRNPRLALFSPTDSRVPRMKVPMEQCPPTFFKRPEDFANTMFVARLENWEAANSSTGSIIRSLGENTDIQVRTEGLLLEHNIDYSEFPESVVADLPSNHATWSIPEPELKLRRDFRSECVFTIDPLTARDLDDALSVTHMPDGNYRVAVHIADVSYFVKEGTELDRAAGSRTTSTYLVQQVIPMLPRQLCENLCSLNPGEDRLTYTVEWTMDQDGNIKSEWFGRTVIRSCVKLAYEHAQSMIDEPEKLDFQEGALPAIESPYTVEDISMKVNMLQMLSVKIRKRREDAGYLKLNQPKLSFSLNPDTGLPDGFRLHQHKHSNKLIEEFMLLANMAVARKIYTSFPALSVLRRHPQPKGPYLDILLKSLQSLGVVIDSSSAGAIGQSLAAQADCPLRDAVLSCMLSKPMELAQYFCTGMFNEPDYHHYALNVPFYTHFTSPIRRYPDILVHRLLDYAVRGEEPAWDGWMVQQQCILCNDKRLAAKRIGEESALLFLSLFIAESGPIHQVGSVVGVLDHAIDILLVNLGITKRVYVDKLDVENFNVRRVNSVNYIDIVWRQSKRRQTLTIFSKVDVNLIKSEKPFDFLAIIRPPGELKQEVIDLSD